MAAAVDEASFREWRCPVLGCPSQEKPKALECVCGNWQLRRFFIEALIADSSSKSTEAFGNLPFYFWGLHRLENVWAKTLSQWSVSRTPVISKDMPFFSMWLFEPRYIIKRINTTENLDELRQMTRSRNRWQRICPRSSSPPVSGSRSRGLRKAWHGLHVGKVYRYNEPFWVVLLRRDDIC